jgi:hypothetical protein
MRKCVSILTSLLLKVSLVWTPDTRACQVKVTIAVKFVTYTSIQVDRLIDL